MQGQALRDSATQFAAKRCVVVGASFDTPEENKAFRDAQGFGYPLVSDVDKRVGAAYGVTRDPGAKYADFPLRASFLIDPAGVVRRIYDVTDVAGHAAAVLADLDELLQTN